MGHRGFFLILSSMISIWIISYQNRILRAAEKIWGLQLFIPSSIFFNLHLMKLFNRALHFQKYDKQSNNWSVLSRYLWHWRHFFEFPSKTPNICVEISMLKTTHTTYVYTYLLSLVFYCEHSTVLLVCHLFVFHKYPLLSVTIFPCSCQ